MCRASQCFIQKELVIYRTICYNRIEERDAVVQKTNGGSNLFGHDLTTKCHKKDIMPTKGCAKPIMGTNLLKIGLALHRYFQQKSGLEPSPTKFSWLNLYITPKVPVNVLLYY